MSTETIEWIDRFGRSVTLVHGRPLIGFHGSPPVRRSERTVPGRAGAVSDVAPFHNPRDLSMPILIQATSRAERTELTRTYTDLLGDGEDGRLRFTHGDGTQREIDCYLASGLEDLVDVMPSYVMPTFEFRANWPYWRDVAAEDISIELDFDEIPTTGTGTPTDDPNTGVNDPIPTNGYTGDDVTSGVVTFALNHQGTAPLAFPVWKITGPFTLFEVTNLTTAKTLQFDGSVTTGQTLTIDTRPEAQTVEVAGANRFFDTAEGVSLWPLVKDTNQIKIRLIATGPTTTINVSWAVEHQSV